jgi:hypothetical protein
MAEWLKDCEICNVGLCSEVNSRKENGLTEHKACVQMSEESEGLYSAAAIRNRYQYHTGKKKVAQNEQRAFVGEFKDFDVHYKALKRLIYHFKKQDWDDVIRTQMLNKVQELAKIIVTARR